MIRSSLSKNLFRTRSSIRVILINSIILSQFRMQVQSIINCFGKQNQVEAFSCAHNILYAIHLSKKLPACDT